MSKMTPATTGIAPDRPCKFCGIETDGKFTERLCRYNADGVRVELIFWLCPAHYEQRWCAELLNGASLKMKRGGRQMKINSGEPAWSD